jgi:hypothetical protein
MNHRWILDFELMLEWNGDLLLWGYNTRNLHGSDSLKVFCINKRDEEILMIRRRHQTFVIESYRDNYTLFTWFDNLVFFWEHEHKVFHFDVVLVKVFNYPRRVLDNIFERSSLAINAAVSMCISRIAIRTMGTINTSRV